jgi:hypothetical protein
MSGLTKIGKEILDFHDSGLSVDVIAAVLNVSESIIRVVIKAYAGTGQRGDMLDELVPDCLLAPALADGHL